MVTGTHGLLTKDIDIEEKSKSDNTIREESMQAHTLNKGQYAWLKRILIALSVVVLIAGLAVSFSVSSAIKGVPLLFERNAELKAQGFYMGEFEFKMLTVIYYLNEGSYIKAYSTLRRIASEMESTRGLVKMPEGASPAQQMDFLLQRQDPDTGAFMDPSYPLFTYYAPTANVILALNELAHKTGRPLKLKYPLRFLDWIQTPEHLQGYLGPLLYIKERWAEMAPVGPYVAGVSELADFDTLEKLGVHQFGGKWKETLQQWFYETQDPATGYWGVRIGSPEKWWQQRDVNSTYHILQGLVLNERGENRSEKYPLRHADVLARNILESLTAPIPDNPTEQHDWGLAQSHGAGLITGLLWPRLSEAEKEAARTAMRTCVTSRYRLFRPADGGFAIYTSATGSDVDGTGNALSLLKSIGSLPGTREREQLWGKEIASVPELVSREIHRWEEVSLPAAAHLNSVRVFKNDLPAGDTYDDANLVEIIYPGSSTVLDVMDLRRHIAGFIATDDRQMFGNWWLKESLRNEPLDLNREIRTIPVSHNGLDLARLAVGHSDARRFYLIGYDLFQVPVFRAEFVMADLSAQPWGKSPQSGFAHGASLSLQ